MSRTLCLNCWVFGDTANRIFTVKITETDSVSTLKKAIKEENPVAFQHVDAVAIDLWQVSVRCLDASRSTPDLWQVDVPADDSALSKISLDGVKPLLSVKRLSGLFEPDPADENVHIVIQRPPNGVYRHLPPRILGYLELSIIALSYQLQSDDRTLCLNCWVFGDKSSRVFTVEIADTKNVGALKDAIKEKNAVAFRHVDAVAIDLWQVRERIAQRCPPLIYLAGLHSSGGPPCCLAKAPRSRTCERCQQTGPHRSIVGAV
jgi:hypothetical protein